MLRLNVPVAGLALVAGLLMTSASSLRAADAMLRGLDGWTVSPLHTIGEAIGDYVPVGKPDGIGAFRRRDGSVRIFVNHELWRSRGTSYRLRNDVELTGARISYFDVDARSRTIIAAGIATATVFDRAHQPVTTASSRIAQAAGARRRPKTHSMATRAASVKAAASSATTGI